MGEQPGHGGRAGSRPLGHLRFIRVDPSAPVAPWAIVSADGLSRHHGGGFPSDTASSVADLAEGLPVRLRAERRILGGHLVEALAILVGEADDPVAHIAAPPKVAPFLAQLIAERQQRRQRRAAA